MSPEQIEQAKRIINEATKTVTINVSMLERGLGLGSDGVIVSYHKDYSRYHEFMILLKRVGEEFLSLDDVKSFLIDLQDEVRFIPLTMSLVANDVARAEHNKVP